MNKHTKGNLRKTMNLFALVFASCATMQLMGSITQESAFFTVQTAPGTGCPGGYTAYAKMTNAIGGGFWISGTNASGSTGIFTDASGFPSPYVSVVQVIRKSDNKKWCDTNSVAFPVTNTASYSFTVYVKSPVPPPTNSQMGILQVAW